MEFLSEWLPFLMLPVMAIVLFSGYPVALILAGVGLLFTALGWLTGDIPGVAFLNLPLRIGATFRGNLIYPAVPMLLFMGLAIEKSGVAREMLLCMRVLLRRVPASMTIAVIILGILLAPAAGLIGASVATLAIVALPTMLEQGYKPSIATGSVAAAGTLGIILPPGIMLFFLAQHLNISMGSLFLATIVPGLGLAVLFMIYYVGRAAWDGTGAPPIENEFKGQAGKLLLYVFRSLALPIALIALVLGSIIAGWATPTEAAAVGAAGGVLLMALTRTLTPRLVNEVVKGTVITTSMVFFIVVAATVFSYPFRYLGGDDVIIELMGATGLGDFGLLAVILLTIFVLGFFIDWIEIVVITLPIFYPIISELDFASYVGSEEMARVWVAVLIGLVLQSSFLTPPFGFALFFVKGAAPPEVRIADIYWGAMPIVAIQVVGVCLVWLLPAIAIGLPMMAME
jgi:tripartite ATP-independent transporter DctM subunit